MRIAYLSTDEVNLDLARRWASTCGCEVVPLTPRDPRPNGEYDAAIYDLDFLPPMLRQRVLTDLSRGSWHGPVAVHSYNLGAQQVRDLHVRGVHVRRRLEREVLVLLRRDVQRVREHANRAPTDAITSTRPANYLSEPPSSSNTFLAG